MNNTERFMALFRGNERSFGQFDPKKNRMTTIKSAPNIDYFDNHLKGKMGIAIVPIRDDGYCYFAAIDIDNHNDEIVNVIKIEAAVKSKGLPLIVCKSKSGGCHLYLFGAEPLKVAIIRGILGAWARELGFPEAEVFPKQSYLRIGDNGERPYGNLINLPYFNEDQRLAIENGKETTFDFFLTNAEVSRITQNQLESIYNKNHPDAPPCIQKMIAGGIDSGSRNEALYNITIYLRKAFENDYRDKAFDMNMLIFDKPLSHGEANKTITSAGRRVYKYRCSEEPCKSLCDSKVCLTRKFGITKTDAENLGQLEEIPEFSNLRKILIDPVAWEIDVDGKRLRVDTKTLTNSARMREAVLDGMTMLLPPIPQKDWDKILGKLVPETRIIEAPKEASASGVIIEHLIEFLKKADFRADPNDIKNREALNRNMPVVQSREEGLVIYFKSLAFMDYLKRNRVNDLKGPDKIYMALKDGGADSTKIRIKGVPQSVWYFPAEMVSQEEFNEVDFKPDF